MPSPISALAQAFAASSESAFRSFDSLQVGRPLVEYFPFLSKSITALTAALGMPGGTLVEVLVLISIAAGVRVDFDSFFGLIVALAVRMVPGRHGARGTDSDHQHTHADDRKRTSTH